MTIDVVRHQKPEQAGERAIRTGVFFLPEKKSPYQRYYTTGRQGYGGTQRIEGRTTFENPIIAKGASGGKVPERAYDAINGEGAYDEMRQDVLDATTHGWNQRSRAEVVQNVANVLENYGGNPNLAEDIVRNSKEGNTLAYAVQEHIVASSVRKAGHDGIVGFSKIKGQPRLSEVFDLRHDKYPISSELFESKYQPSEKASPNPQSEPEEKAERRAGVGGYSGDSPTESQFVQKVIQGGKDTETWAPADMGDGGKAWLDKDGKYIPQDKEHQDIAENFWNRSIRIGNLERKGPLLVHAEGAPTEAQRKAIAADIKKQGGAIYDLKKDGNNVAGEAKTVGDFLRAIDSTWKPETSLLKQTTATQIDLSGLRVRPVGAGRQPANWTAFIASDGRKYRFPSNVSWEQIVKADPGAKRIK